MSLESVLEKGTARDGISVDLAIQSVLADDAWSLKRDTLLHSADSSISDLD